MARLSSAGWPRLLLAAALATLLGAGEPGTLDAGGGQTWVPLSSFTDAQGRSHTRLAHHYQGLRILGSEAILYQGAPRDRHGLPLPPPGDLEGVDAELEASLLHRLELAPSLSEAQARGIVQRELGGSATPRPPPPGTTGWSCPSRAGPGTRLDLHVVALEPIEVTPAALTLSAPWVVVIAGTNGLGPVRQLPDAAQVIPGVEQHRAVGIHDGPLQSRPGTR